MKSRWTRGLIAMLWLAAPAVVVGQPPSGSDPKSKALEGRKGGPPRADRGGAVVKRLQNSGTPFETASMTAARDVVVDFGGLQLAAASAHQIAAVGNDCLRQIMPQPVKGGYRVEFDPLLASNASEAGGMMIGRIRLNVQYHPSEPPMKESEVEDLLEKVCRQIDSRLQRAASLLREQHLKEQELAGQDVEHRRRRADDLQAGLDGLWKRVDGGSVGTRETQMARIADLFTQRNALKQEITGVRARQRRLEEHVSRIEKEAAVRGLDDRTVAAIQSVLAKRKEELAFRRKQMKPEFYDKAVAVRELEMKVAEGEAELARERAIAVRTAGTSQLGTLKVDLIQLDVRSAEAEAKLELVEKMISAAPSSNDVSAFSSELESERAALARAQERYNSARQAVGSFRSPRLIMMDADAPKPKGK